MPFEPVPVWQPSVCEPGLGVWWWRWLRRPLWWTAQSLPWELFCLAFWSGLDVLFKNIRCVETWNVEMFFFHQWTSAVSCRPSSAVPTGTVFTLAVCATRRMTVETAVTRLRSFVWQCFIPLIIHRLVKAFNYFDNGSPLLNVSPSGREPTKRPCTVEEFKCTNGNCVALPYVCDHNDNCGDLTDELGCSKLHNNRSLTGINTLRFTSYQSSI